MSSANQERGALAHLSNGFRIALARPRVVIFLVGLSIFLALPVAMPVHQSAVNELGRFASLTEAVDLLVSAPRWLLDAWARQDPHMASSASVLLAPLMLLSSLLGILIAGGWMACAREDKGRHALSAFFEGGGLWFFPFFRVWILGLFIYAFNTWLIWGMPGDWVVEQFLPDGKANRAVSENTGRWVNHTREIVFLLALMKTEIFLDLARASMVARERRSAIGGFIRAIGLWLRRFPRILRLVGVGYALEGGWIFATLATVQWMAWPMVTLVFLLPLGRVICRGARLAGLATFCGEQSRLQMQSQTPLPTDPPEALLQDGTAWAGGETDL